MNETHCNPITPTPATLADVKERKKVVDWEAVECMYRAHVLSTREIARQHGITEGAVRKKAKEHTWGRDLSACVREKVRNELIRTPVRTADAIFAAAKQAESTMVDASAAHQVQVVRDHRSVLRRMHSIAVVLLHELEVQTAQRALYEELGDLLRTEDENGHDKRNDFYRKIIASANRVDSVKKLAETMKIIVGLERQAFNIGDNPPPAQDALSALLATIASRPTRLPVRSERVIE